MTLVRLLRNRRIWLGAGTLVAILALRASELTDVLALDALTVHRDALAGFVSHNMALSVAIFVLTYTGVVAFSVPGAAILTLSGGFLFGAIAGTLLAVVGATAGATLVFLFARILLGKDALARLGPSAERLALAIRRNAASYLLVLRLVPLFPFVLVNLAPAFAGVRLSTYVLTTFFGIIPGTAVFSLTGAGLGSILEAGGTLSLAAVLTPEILGALIGLAILSLAAIPLRARFSRAG